MTTRTRPTVAEIEELVRRATLDGRDTRLYAVEDEDDEMIIDGKPRKYWAVRYDIDHGTGGSGEAAVVHQRRHAPLLAAALVLAEMLLEVTAERDQLVRTYCPPLFDPDALG